MAEHPHITSRRRMLAGSAVLAVVGAPPVMAANPDAEVIRLAEEFLAAEIAKDARVARFYDLPAPWSKEDHAEFATFCCTKTRYHERMAEITEVDVTTPEGLAAQAKVLLWHSRFPEDDLVKVANLAENVLRVLKQPLPEWARDAA